MSPATPYKTDIDAIIVHYQKQASIWNTWLLIKKDFSGPGPELDLLLVIALLKWKMLPPLAPLESDPSNPPGVQVDLVVEGAWCHRHCGSEERRVPGLHACGGRWGAGLDHFISVGKVHWGMSTRCLVRCGAENCCVPNDCTVSIALRNASFPRTHTDIYLPTLPFFLKGTSPLQLCRWQLALALLHTHRAPNVAFLFLLPPFPLPKLLFHAMVPANFSIGCFAFTWSLLLYADNSSSNLKKNESQKNGMVLFIVPIQ